MFRGFVVGVILTAAVIAAVGYVAIIRGAVPAAALNAKPVPLEHWAARTSLRATLANESPQGANPVPLSDQNLIAGIELYGQHCAFCHGTAKGDAAPTPVAQGEYPRPPQLGTDGVEDDPEGWTFWKIKNGIRWTGMPAWSGALSDQQIWTLALFLKHMDKLPPAASDAWQQVKN